MLHTRKVLLKHTEEALFLHWCNTQDGGWNQTEVLRAGTTTYYEATIYHRRLITPTFCLCDMWSDQYFITATNLPLLV